MGASKSSSNFGNQQIGKNLERVMNTVAFDWEEVMHFKLGRKGWGCGSNGLVIRSLV